MTRTSLVLLLLATFAAAAGQVLFKYGARGREQFIEFLNIQIACGAAFYLLGTAIWIYVLSIEKLVDVYAFTALTFVLVYLAGVVLIGEKVSLYSMTGVALILGGLYLIAVKGA